MLKISFTTIWLVIRYCGALIFKQLSILFSYTGCSKFALVFLLLQLQRQLRTHLSLSTAVSVRVSRKMRRVLCKQRCVHKNKKKLLINNQIKMWVMYPFIIWKMEMIKY